MAETSATWRNEVGPVFPLKDNAERIMNTEFAKRQIATMIERCVSRGASPREAKKAAATELLIALVSHAGWAEHGLNSFEISAAHASLFLHTDVGEFWDEALSFPYATQAMVLPNGWLKGTDTRGNVVDFSMAMVSKFVHIDGKEMFLFRLQSKLFEIHMKETRETLIGMDSRGDPSSFHEMAGSDLRSLDAVKKMALSFFVWLNTGAGSAQKDSRWKKKRTKERHLPTKWHLSRVTKIPGLIAESKRVIEEGCSGSTYKLRTQHIVRGHFRNQACGPKRSERRRIWIVPFWKGPDTEEAWARVYKTASGGAG
jgi:hypothetical protein